MSQPLFNPEAIGFPQRVDMNMTFDHLFGTWCVLSTASDGVLALYPSTSTELPFT